jgi:S1-C subfamily serine protease
VTAGLVAAVLGLAAAPPEPAPAAPRAGSATYERVRKSVVTVEVHSGNREAKSGLGSGYLVSEDGRVVTNYHVVSAFVAEPERYRVRVRGDAGERPARLVAFDVENDLALLHAPGLVGRPLALADALPPAGTEIVAFGNPHGLGLSLIEGIYNGFAAKGAVDRMLLSMPLNSGMSGGPILDGAGRVIGTNVSVMFLSNSLSFGVPVTRLRALLAAPEVGLDRDALAAEVTRQLGALEAAMAKRVVAAYAASGEAVRVGGVESRRPPDVFECWDDTQVFQDQGLTKARLGCDLQFTPQVHEVGPVGSVALLVEHFKSARNRYGFYAHLEAHAPSHLEVEPRDPEGGVLTAPRCTSDRVAAGSHVWRATSCVSALVDHPGFFNFDVVATSVTDAHEAAFVALHLKGVRLSTFQDLLRPVLAGTRLAR